jgi:hypothetical protein
LGLVATVCSVMMLVGCTMPEGKNVFYVMFADKPSVIDNTVYFRGNEMGKILSRKSGFDNIVEMKISILKEHRPKMKNNVVFLISKGRLEYDTFNGAGELISDGTALLGFNSKAALNWFKVKNVLGNLTLEASQKATTLFEKIRWIELEEIPT